MDEEEKIIIDIDENGKISADLDGFKGEACIEEISELLEGLAEINSIEKKDDYFMEDETYIRKRQERKQKLGGG